MTTSTTTAALALTPLASNMTELRLEGVRVLFSYSTPVACHLTDPGRLSVVVASNLAESNPRDVVIDAIGQVEDVRTGYYRTAKKWSPTTTRHINNWLREEEVDESPATTANEAYLDFRNSGHGISTVPQEFFDELLNLDSARLWNK